MCLFQLRFSQGICPVVGLLNHMVVLFLVFKEISILCSVVAYQFIFLLAVQRVPFSPHSLQHFCRLLNDGHSWHEVIAHRSCDLHFSNNEWCWTPCHVFLTICMSSFKKCLFRSSAHFFGLGSLLFWYWAAWAVRIFWRSILCQLFCLQLFSPILRVVF